MKSLGISLAFLLFTTLLQAQSAPDSATVKFNTLLAETGMTFNKPNNVVQIPVVANRQMHYELAIKYPDKPLEIRYAISSLKPFVDRYNTWKANPKPGEMIAEPNAISKTVAYSVALNVGGGSMDPSIKLGAFPPEMVKKEFGADWGLTSLINVKNNSFGTEYKWCMMIAIHKDNVADAYVFFLTDNQETLSQIFKSEQLVKELFYALRFKQ